MEQVVDTLRLSASDLVGHVDCQHLTTLNAQVARGEKKKPKLRNPVLETLFERGLAHERAYVEHLKAQGLKVFEIDTPGVGPAPLEKTRDAMRSGADVVVQGVLANGSWSGRADVLRRVEQPSLFGAWSYEVIDTKLARRTKGATILQLCLYSDLLTVLQGRVPEHLHVVRPGTGFALETYRTADYGAYFRRARQEFERFLGSEARISTYPEPNEHCDLCPWRVPCDEQRRADDHLCLVAGISQLQIGELKRQGIETTARLAAMPVPLTWTPDRGSAATFERIRQQARIQVEGRAAGRTLYETLPIEAGLGLARLPAPSPGDVFFDLEGDPFVEDGGLEYLFGYAFAGDEGTLVYRGEWAFTREEERRAFEGFVDSAIARWKDYPNLHIYHYAPYEPSALKRLMGRYATREDEIDRMLRGALFVDLYQVVRQGIRASVESYSIKQLESLYAFTRATPLEAASRALAVVQASVESEDVLGLTEPLKATVAGYNREDCLSAAGLRDWLEGVRAGLIAQGATIERPSASTEEAGEAQTEWQARIARLVERLTADVPADPHERSVDSQARWILAYVLDWHRREEKTLWWEYFRLAGLSGEDLLPERAGLSGLSFVGVVGGTPKAPVHRYRFPAQETELRGGEPLHQQGGEKFGKVERISLDERTVDVKKRKDTASVHPQAVFSHNVIATGVLAEALARIGEHVADHGMAGEGAYLAARDLLMRGPPRLVGEPLRVSGESAVEAAVRIAPQLQGGVLPIQGPPGTGKTHIGARMICALVKAGAQVGITGTSHKVIRRLLDETVTAAGEWGLDLRCLQKADELEEDRPHLTFTSQNEEVFDSLESGVHVAAGTAWLWARPEAQECVDVLFVDEAAQMSLANVLAVSHAAKTLVLLGDPQQLDQPTQGSHPDGTGVSALDHLLGGQKTISETQGLFLSETWRLHPDICAFTSELFYEDRLRSVAGLERQAIRSTGAVRGAGLRYVPVEHEGNQSSCPEEAEAIEALVRGILDSSTTWIDRHGLERPVGLEDILVIAPYNAQVFELKDRIPGGRIGTVDKFQGQEAPIVIYSMTTSTHSDAPRGMSFLYSLNRLNVASSRARALSILVSSPDLFEPECRTPEQMLMANAFCRYLERAGRV